MSPWSVDPCVREQRQFTVKFPSGFDAVAHIPCIRCCYQVTPSHGLRLGLAIALHIVRDVRIERIADCLDSGRRIQEALYRASDCGLIEIMRRSDESHAQ